MVNIFRFVILFILQLPAFVQGFVIPRSWVPSCKARASTVLMTATTQHVVVGKGRVGEALGNMLGSSTVMVGRNDPVPVEGTGPIYVATRNDDLAAVVEKTPEARRKDLVFLQNGMLGPFLKKYGLEDNTQALVYFAVARKGDVPTDGVTDLNPNGLTAVYGEWAADFEETLTKAGLKCHILDKGRFQAAMFEKLMWISAFMLVGSVHGGITVGEVEKSHREDVVALIQELKKALERHAKVTFQDGVEDRLCAYARSVAHFPTAVKEFPWRNGFFWNLSEEAVGRGEADPCPSHSAMLKQVGAV